MDEGGPADRASRVDTASPPTASPETVAERTPTARPAADPIQRGATLGRYVVLDRIGSGGMGVVYAAYDPDLDRKVAIKVIRSGASRESSSERRARLLREGQALARLSHPHVVAVHDVGEADGLLFVAMEMIEGSTLSRWLEERERSWREILAVFRDAAQGLAAAHDAGLVHRDFKPQNVCVTPAGRARVLDFGLAREPDDAGGEPREPAAIAGTPGYMSPEQVRGAALDARTDQFAFCVALHEALYGERPFAGDDPEAVALAAERGEIRSGRRDARVPAWIRPIVLGGLRADPAERHPNMTALIAALDADPGAKARRVAVVGGVSALVVGAIVTMIVGLRLGARAERNPCGDAEDRLAGAWDAPRRRALAEAFTATRAPYAASAIVDVTRRLDGYASRWAAKRTEACEATRRGDQSHELFDLENECLDRARASLAATSDLFRVADAKVVERALQVVEGLPDLEACDDARALRERVATPDDPRVRAAIDRIHGEVERARALLHAGRYTDGEAVAATAAGLARAIAHRPIEASALYVLGRLQYQLGRDALAEETLIDAAAAATAARDDVATADAWISLIAVATSRNQLDRSRQWSRVARSALERTGDRGRALEGPFFDHVGRRLYAEGKYDEAAATLRRSLERIEALEGPDARPLAVPLWNLGVVLSDQGKHDEAAAALERAVAVLERAHGPDHPSLGRPLSSLGVVLTDQGRYDRAREVLERSVGVTERALGPNHADLASVLTNLGVVLESLGRLDEAIVHLQRALAIKEQTLGEWHPSVSITLGNLGGMMLAARSFDQARPILERAIAIKEKAQGPSHPSLAFPLTTLGDLEVQAGRPEHAIPLLERALALRTANRVNVSDLAYTQFALARALWDRGVQLARARQLAEQARGGYEASGEAGRKELAAVQAWLDERIVSAAREPAP